MEKKVYPMIQTSESNTDKLFMYEAANDDILAAVYLKKSPIKITYKREFQKFIDLLSYFGGFFNVVITIVGTIIRDYNRQAQYMFLANSMYNFVEFDKKKKDKKSSSSIN